MNNHCCNFMTEHAEFRCKEHADVFECVDQQIFYKPSPPEYGIIIHDGGNSYIRIQYCPWCGKKLPVEEMDDIKSV